VAKFKKGQSGNPKGRTPGSGEVAKLRAELAKHLPEAIEALLAKVREGDVSALRVYFDRILPPLKSVDRPVPLPLPDGLAAQGRAIIEAMGHGSITPEEAASIMSAVAAQARVIEVDELERRVAALEGKHGKP
jgi:hypothetical protein